MVGTLTFLSAQGIRLEPRLPETPVCQTCLLVSCLPPQDRNRGAKATRPPSEVDRTLLCPEAWKNTVRTNASWRTKIATWQIMT